MKRFSWKFYGVIAVSAILLGCSKAKSQNEKPAPEPPKPVTEYRNPVFTPILADPTVIKDPNSDYYYAYGTEDFWHTDNKNHLVAVVRSRDLVNWTYVSDAFTVKPNWKSAGGIWARI
ncbi:family 43 glycosylhydrolase [Niabella hibiscisoli]|nr:family 43 glycosylhydrolase [Niabella hibiscisoli]MCH5720586.1 family 43 glycosylhydrolase [Niabella hibiscisoli]